jgi:hypothetical protein
MISHHVTPWWQPIYVPQVSRPPLCVCVWGGGGVVNEKDPLGQPILHVVLHLNLISEVCCLQIIYGICFELFVEYQ